MKASKAESLSIYQAIQKQPINLLCMAIAAAVYAVNKLYLIDHMPGWFGYFCQCHLNDLVCPLFFLAYCQIMLIWAGHALSAYMSFISLGLLGGLLWEYVAPWINPNAVSDPIDLVCYFAGSTGYYFLLKWYLKRQKVFTNK